MACHLFAMVRVRFLAWWPLSLFVGIASLGAQNKSLFPNSRAPAQSSALRSQPRRPPPPRPDTVALPFNLYWGDTQNRLASLFAGIGAKVTNKKAQGQAEVWTVEGLIAPNLQASQFTFAQGSLVALEFDYGQPDWNTDRYNEVMGQFRRLLEVKCEKPGEIVSRQTDQPVDASVKQSLMGYEWKRGDTLVQLFYFSAEDTAKSLAYRSISVHYHMQEIVPLDAGPLPEIDRNTDPNANPLFGGNTKAAPGASPAASASLASSPQYGPPPPPTPTPKPNSRDSDPLPER